MATKFWLGIADAIAQVSTVQITAFDAATTYELTVGGVTVSAPGNTDANTTASDLAAAWNASVHPYFTGVTASPSTDTITLTADVAGVPFEASSSVQGGTGTIGAVTEATANSGPCDWSVAENWSDGAIPANADTVIFRDNDVNVAFGLSNPTLLLVELRVEQTYTGKIGLDRTELVTSADGETTDPSKVEYREDFLRVDVDDIEIGKHVGRGTAAGSGRIKISNESIDAATITVFSTATVPAETALTPVRLKANGANTDVFIRSGLVGLGIDEPGEACTIGDLFINGSTTKVFMGIGCAVNNVVQSDGESLIQASSTIASIKLIAGLMTTEGDYTITAATVEGGQFNANHIKTAGNAITTLNANGGEVVGTKTSEPRTWATVNADRGASLSFDPNQVTVTTFNDPTDEYTVTYS